VEARLDRVMGLGVDQSDSVSRPIELPRQSSQTGETAVAAPQDQQVLFVHGGTVRENSQPSAVGWGEQTRWQSQACLVGVANSAAPEISQGHVRRVP
jgi:hypothetical protein